MKILITGGAGFIGSNLVRYVIKNTEHSVVNVDALTYAGNLESLRDIEDSERYEFVQCDITDATAVSQLFEEHQPNWVMHLAAESHVDRSIDGPGEFIQTNVIGTFNLLQSALAYYQQLPEGDREQKAVTNVSAKPPAQQSLTFRRSPLRSSHFPTNELTKSTFRFLHVSTDEVYGSLSKDDPAFSETTSYDPHSPYSASKAASDHLARAWKDTYGLPVLITNCSNNYGPYQFPEKLIPVVILKCLKGEPIPVYGKGENIRDWLYVEDHASALYTVISKGKIGETYNIGGNNEQQNITIVKEICKILDELHPVDSISTNALPNFRTSKLNKSYQDLITFVTDRPGHDLRYAINAEKIKNELGWEPKETFETGFRKTVKWYLENQDWWERLLP